MLDVVLRTSYIIAAVPAYCATNCIVLGIRGQACIVVL